MGRVLRVLSFLAMSALLPGAAPSVAQGAAETVTVRPLTLTRWHLVRLDGARVPRKSGVSLAFTASGRMEGFAGCNDFDGTWTWLGGERLAIGLQSATRARCATAVARSERLFLDRLVQTTSFSLDGRELAFASSVGSGLVFRAGARTGDELTGDWALAAIDGSPAPDYPRSTVTFDGSGGVSGTGGCDAFRSSYAIDDDAISFGPIRTGFAACPDHAMAQESAFLDALQGADSWSADEDTLTLGQGRHALELRRVRPVTHDFTGTTWSLVSITGTGANGVVGSTIRFEPDGTVSGWSGCNTFRGPWSVVDGTGLHVGPLMTTRTTCDQAWMDLETAYLHSLEDVLGYKTPDGAALWLTTRSGARMVFDPPLTPSLTGTQWKLADIAGTPVGPPTTIILHFLQDASVSGNAGCDMYLGWFEQRGDSLRIEDVTTMGDRGCDPAVTEVQRSFLSLLPLVDGLRFEGPDLLLRFGDQALRFRDGRGP
jgi:heat shock protein HslJ